MYVEFIQPTFSFISIQIFFLMPFVLYLTFPECFQLMSTWDFWAFPHLHNWRNISSINSTWMFLPTSSLHTWYCSVPLLPSYLSCWLCLPTWWLFFSREHVFSVCVSTAGHGAWPRLLIQNTSLMLVQVIVLNRKDVKRNGNACSLV